jgi:hypothetical protein
MLRITLGVVAGLVVGMVVTGVIEALGHALFPPPPGVNLTDPAAMASVMAKIPLGAKVGVLVAWFLGVLVGASTALLIAGRRQPGGWIVGAVLFAFAAWTMATIPHPAWMIAGAVLAELAAVVAADRAFGRPRTA